MKKRTILHEKCEGLIETFGKNYGLCRECGTEGNFVVTKKEKEVTYIKFTKITVIRK